MAGIRIPITNIYGGGDYTAPISVGSQAATANVILDTGSSTLAVQQTSYNPANDTALVATATAQDITYGTGGWAGPVVNTKVSMGAGPTSVSLTNANLAIAADQQAGNFGPADGILGLAYTPLDNGYDMTEYLTSQGEAPKTYPWPFNIQNSGTAIGQFQQFLAGQPAAPVTPFFTQLAQNGSIANKFGFYTLRSTPSMRTSTPQTDPLNQGFFILGGGEEQTDLFTGGFINVDVVDDVYYNTTLNAVQVGNGTPFPVAPLPSQFVSTMASNSIVDSGTNSLALSPAVFNGIMKGLRGINPQFETLGKQALQSQNGIPSSQLNLSEWPNINFILNGDAGGNVTLTVAPSTYWQVDSPAAGQASFQIGPFGQVQSILGLPLFNNYFVVFDRSDATNGVIRFAPISAPTA